MRRFLGASISQFGLKMIAVVCMICYVVSKTILQYGVLHMDEMDTQTLFQAMSGGSVTLGIASVAVCLELLAGVALSIYAFLLVEGFEHTEKYAMYMGNLIIFSMLSEVPYDYAMSHKLMDWSSQNPMFALVVGLILMYGIRMVQADHEKHIVICACLILAGLIWCYLLHIEYGTWCILLVSVYYLLRYSHGWRIFWGVLVGMPMVTGILATYPLFIYNGQRGNNYNKYIFYFAFPVTLVLCSMICMQLR